MHNEQFWLAIDSILQDSEIKIDRPKGSEHPKMKGIIYPVDYGYLEGTKSPDNAGIDIYVGSIDNGIADAVICTIDLFKKDSEIKILLGCTEEEKKAVYKIYTERESLQGEMIHRNKNEAISIKHMQQYIKMKDFNPEKSPNYILKFMEESGELAKAILHGYPHAQGENIKNTLDEEFCDVLYYLLAIANLHDVDIEKWIPVKERETDKRYNTDYYNRYFKMCRT